MAWTATSQETVLYLEPREVCVRGQGAEWMGLKRAVKNAWMINTGEQ